MNLYFSQYFMVDPKTLRDYGAFDISIATDLPLFIDPFLLFNSNKEEYKALHESILKYLRFLREKAASGPLDPALVANLYRFKEVKQNWFGFTVLGNGGHGLGHHFAVALHSTIGRVLGDTLTVTQSNHLEKVSLLKAGVGRDSISDFATNLIKGYLLEYTQAFAQQHLKPEQCRVFRVRRATFNYETESWQDGDYYLPVLWNDFALLTPIDMLTRDETWINPSDMVDNFWRIPSAIPDNELRAQVNNYFAKSLGASTTKADRVKAAFKTISEFPDLIDFYISLKEQEGDQAQAVSLERVDDTMSVFVTQLRKAVEDLRSKTNFYDLGHSSYEEALERVLGFKHYVENQDGYKLINRKGAAFAQETEVQLFFGLIWFGSLFDVNREVNNGRGPVDFKISIGAADKSLIEFKLASNTHLKRNLENQVAIYEAANQTKKSVKVIICYTEKDQEKVKKILKDLKLESEDSVVVIDARSDNKPSASTA